MRSSTVRIIFLAILAITSVMSWTMFDRASAGSSTTTPAFSGQDIGATRAALGRAMAEHTARAKKGKSSEVANAFRAYKAAVDQRKAEIYERLKQLDILIAEPPSDSVIDDPARSPYLHPRPEVSGLVAEYDSYRAELSALINDFNSVKDRGNLSLGVQAATCPPSTAINGTLGSGSPDFPATSGQQTGRITNGLGNTDCGDSNPCTLNTATGLRSFDAYTFSNPGATTACVTVDFTMTGCALGQSMQFSARLGSFDPANPCTNYVGDGGAGFAGEVSNSFSFNVPAGQDFVVVVNENDPAGATGCAYTLTISGVTCPPTCPPATITGTIGQGSTDFPGTSGVQTGRISQNGVDSTCAAPKTCPNIASAGVPFAFDSYQFFNDSGIAACVTFTFPTACGVNNAVHPAAYLGSFDPNNPCTNYLGDIGHSINSGESGAFSVTVPANSIVVLVVHEVGTQPGCADYSFSVTGLPQCLPCPPTTAITGTISQGSTDYPSASGVQTGRISQNGVDSSCAAPKTCPSIASAGVPFAFDSYQFFNDSGIAACVTFTFPTACGVNNAVHPAAYLGSFDPNNPCTNYLGDIGHSINSGESGAFSVTVPANSIVVLVVHEVGTQPGCQDYSFSVTGLPCQSPCAITCPSNITQPNDPGQCGAVVTYSAPTTSGDCGTVTCSPASGSFFPVGTTTVTCTTEAGPSCSFTVTVNQTQAPAITCPSSVTAAAAASCNQSAGAIVNFPAPTASDSCGSVTPVCSPASGSTFPAGTTTVTCTATGAGGTSNCSFTVTVFGGCLQDDSNAGSVVLFNTATGEYRFCCNGVVIASGIGTVTKKGCEFTIQHNTQDRRVLIKPNFATGKGTASIQSPVGVTKCTITDRNIFNNSCLCGGV